MQNRHNADEDPNFKPGNSRKKSTSIFLWVYLKLYFICSWTDQRGHECKTLRSVENILVTLAYHPGYGFLHT